MIKEEYIVITMTKYNIGLYRKSGIIMEIGDIVNFPVDKIPHKSKIRITAVCDKCGLETELYVSSYYKNYDKYNIYTCGKCSHIKNSKTNIEKYGCEHPLQSNEIKEKMKKTNIEKYGCENVFQNNDIKEKSKQTNLKNLGVEYPQQNKEVLEKSNKTNLERYGCERPSQNEDCVKKMKETKKEIYGDENYNNQEKIKETCQKRYGVDNVSQLITHPNAIRDYFEKKMLEKYECVDEIDYENEEYHCHCKHNHKYIVRIQLFHARNNIGSDSCTICYPEKELTSIKENMLVEYIKENYDGNIIINDRTVLGGKELDVYLPDLNVAFEYNGLYWHSNKHKDKFYHRDKTLNCYKKGIKLIGGRI